MKKYLLMNGPNLNMLGIREPEVYGTTTLATIEEQVVAHGRERGVQVDCFQSNHEGDLVDKLHQAHFDYDGVVYNPGAHTHYSYAIRDAIGSISTPVVEIHISDVDAREPFRQISYAGMACLKTYKGLGFDGYVQAIRWLHAYLKGENPQ